jgi:hypothetical protein
MCTYGSRNAATAAFLAVFGLCHPSRSADAGAALPPLAPPMTAAQVIQVLDQTVNWYRTLGIQRQTASEPSDMLILYDNRQTANKIMALAFDLARADADLLAKVPAATPRFHPKPCLNCGKNSTRRPPRYKRNSTPSGAKCRLPRNPRSRCRRRSMSCKANSVSSTPRKASWREVTLNLPPGVDYAVLKGKLLAAVTGALKDYQAEILRQTKEIARTTLSSSAGDAQPQVQLHFSAAGVEAHVRYPVHLQHAAEIDERVTEALAGAVAAGVPAHQG